MFNNTFREIKGTPFVNNVLSLFTMQLLNYVIPLIIIPFLSNALGENNFGIFSFAQYFSTILMFICDYGFIYTGPILVTMNQNNKQEIDKLFSSIMTIKLMLFFVCVFFVMVYVFFINRTDEFFLIILTLLGVAGNTFTPLWFLQGYQKLRGLTIINAIIKAVQLLLIVFFINDKSDLVKAGIYFFGSIFISGLISFFYTKIYFKINLKLPSLKRMTEDAKNGFVMFRVVFFSSFYINGTGILLRYITGDENIVGHFSIAEKIVRAITYLFNPISSAFIPFITKVFIEDSIKGKQQFFGFLRVVILIAIIAIFIVNICSYFFFDLFFSPVYHDSIYIIAILSPIILFGNIGNMIGNNLFLQLKWEKTTANIVLWMAVINMILCLLLIPVFHDIGAAIALCVVEIIAPIVFILVYNNRKYKIRDLG